MINKVFIGAVSGETQYVASIKSLYAIDRQPGDALYIEFRTRGDVAREGMLSEFLKNKEYDALLMLDSDQAHPQSILTQLRDSMNERDLDMVCAHYYSRSTNLIQSLCYELTGDESYPFLPLLKIPREGIHEIALTGMGCVLIQRRVLEAVQSTMPEGMSAFAIGTLPEEANDYQNWGTDFRFFIMARRMGFRLWLNANVESLHAVTLWLGHKSADKLIDYTRWADGCHDLLMERIKLHGMNLEAFKQRKRILEARLEGLFQQAEPLKNKPEHLTELQELSVSIYKLTGKIEENEAYIEWLEKYPQITRPSDLPTTQNTEPQNYDDGLTKIEIEKERSDMYRRNAIELAEQLPDRTDNG